MSTDVNELNVQGIESNERKEFLLNHDNFELLMRAQREIEAVTEMRPTFKKLINTLINEEAVREVKNKLIEQMS